MKKSVQRASALTLGLVAVMGAASCNDAAAQTPPSENTKPREGFEISFSRLSVVDNENVTAFFSIKNISKSRQQIAYCRIPHTSDATLSNGVMLYPTAVTGLADTSSGDFKGCENNLNPSNIASLGPGEDIDISVRWSDSNHGKIQSNATITMPLSMFARAFAMPSAIDTPETQKPPQDPRPVTVSFTVPITEVK